jgi:hypothetical protein
VICGTAESVKYCYNNQGNSDYEESILGGILAGLLSPKPLRCRQHGNTFDSVETPGILRLRKKVPEMKYHLPSQNARVIWEA